jgi:hypothetical protein
MLGTTRTRAALSRAVTAEQAWREERAREGIHMPTSSFNRWLQGVADGGRRRPTTHKVRLTFAPLPGSFVRP